MGVLENDRLNMGGGLENMGCVDFENPLLCWTDTELINVECEQPVLSSS